MPDIHAFTEKVIESTSKVFFGKNQQIRFFVMAVLSGGHILLDDLPGVGKTTLVKVMAKTMGLDFSRVQFTPDLLPSDIVGMSIFDQKAGDFRTVPGPVMSNIFLADEINRAIPRTQSALLEAMEEMQVTIDGKTYPLPSPFLVMATQNPVEMESTFHLPIAQMDRFLIRLSLGYPDFDNEVEMLRVVGDRFPFELLEKISCCEEITEMQEQVRSVFVSDAVLKYIVSITEATRKSGLFTLPAGPRGSRALYRAGKAWAAMSGRKFITPDDVKTLAPHILAHRVILSDEARLSGRRELHLIEEILSGIQVPPNAEEMIVG